LQKLCCENSYEKFFTAEIINVIQKDDKYHIELDKTYFCPDNGKNFSDCGWINAAPVIYVYEEDEKIYHVVGLKPLKIHKVKCIIDWEKRYNYMQKHLGQHIITACFSELFNASTINFNTENDFSYIDIDKTIGDIEIRTAEQKANKIISDNIPVETLYLNKSELKKLPIKKVTVKGTEKVKIIKIGDFHIQCDEIHAKSTIEVQLLKIIKLEKHKDTMRISFICGSAAISDYFFKTQLIEKVSKLLHCSDTKLLNKVETIADELNKAISHKEELKSKVLQYEVQDILDSAENIENIKIIKHIYDNADLKYINLLSSKLTAFPNVIVLLGIKFDDKSQLIFMCSKDLSITSMNLLLKDAITLIDGKGGGNNFSAQGAGKNNNNLDSSIEYAYNKIKDYIIPKD
jgi:alanyl-tRNA synthetase